MDVWLVFRLVKFVGVALFAGGVMMATGPRSQRERLFAAWGLLPLGFCLSGAAGYGLLKSTGGSMGAPWVGAGMFASVVALHLGLLGARPAQRQAWRGIAARAALGATIGTMVGRGGGSEWLVYGLLGGGLAAGIAWALGRGLPVPPADPAPDAAALTLSRFWWWARLEALSAVALFLVYMPLKYGAGVVLDGGQGWFGWIHGLFTLVFLNGLADARRAGGWSAATTATALVAAMLPGGAWWLEARLRRGPAAGA